MRVLRLRGLAVPSQPLSVHLGDQRSEPLLVGNLPAVKAVVKLSHYRALAKVLGPFAHRLHCQVASDGLHLGRRFRPAPLK